MSQILLLKTKTAGYFCWGQMRFGEFSHIPVFIMFDKILVFLMQLKLIIGVGGIILKTGWTIITLGA